MALAFSLVVLVAVLVAVAVRPRGWTEAVFAVPAAALVVIARVEPWHRVWDQVKLLFPTLAFLAGVFVIAEVADAAGLFDQLHAALAGLGRRGDAALVAGIGILAVAVTSVLSLDATVVLFTPVVIRLVRHQRLRVRDAGLLVTVLLANGGSLLLPVANLTNLLVLQQRGMSYPSFVAHAAIPGVAAAAVIITATVWWARRTAPMGAASAPAPDGAGGPGAQVAPLVASANSRPPLDRLGLAVAVTTGLLLGGFFAASAAGVSPAWVACSGAVVLGGVVLGFRRVRARALVDAANPGFLVFVVGLAVVVDAVSRHGVGRLLDDHLPHGHGLLALLGAATLTGLTAAVLNNLPTTLLVLPALEARGSAVVVAALIGLNVGPSLTYTGSLATLLWRTVVRKAGVEPGARRYLSLAWLTTPLAVVAAVVVLWALAQL